MALRICLTLALFSFVPRVAPAQAPEPGPVSPPAKPCLPAESVTEKGITWVRLCAGSFTMGSEAELPQGYADQKPVHSVTVSELWLGKTETTNAQYRRFRSSQAGEDALPATGVRWDEAQAACESFGGRLPTEAEWEYAARAGSAAGWSHGTDEEKLGEYAWYQRNSDYEAHPAGTKQANAWGLADMHGNVWEWVADWYGPYSSAALSDPRGPATGSSRVLRGGAFSDPAGILRPAVRYRLEPTARSSDIGFRCARDSRPRPMQLGLGQEAWTPYQIRP